MALRALSRAWHRTCPVREAYSQGSPAQLFGRPGSHFGNGAYASAGELVSVSTPAPYRSASSERGYTVPVSGQPFRAPVMKITQGPVPLPTKACSVSAGLANGLPTGMMIIGRQWDDATVLRVAHTFEQAAGGFPRPTSATVGSQS